MKLFKENSYDIVRLYVNQLGIMIFSMLLYSSVGSAFLDNKTLSTALSVFVSVFSVVFYLVLVYYVVWEIGAKDKIRIDGGRMERFKNKGLFMGLFANIPNFVLGFFSTLFLIIFMITENDGVYATFLIFQAITRFHASMYLGFITAVVPGNSAAGNIDYTEFLIESILFTVIPIISTLITHLAYRLGEQDRKLFSFIKSNK